MSDRKSDYRNRIMFAKNDDMTVEMHEKVVRKNRPKSSHILK